MAFWAYRELCTWKSRIEEKVAPRVSARLAGA